MSTIGLLLDELIGYWPPVNQNDQPIHCVHQWDRKALDSSPITHYSLPASARTHPHTKVLSCDTHTSQPPLCQMSEVLLLAVSIRQPV
jgi:hypothetical protein